VLYLSNLLKVFSVSIGGESAYNPVDNFRSRKGGLVVSLERSGVGGEVIRGQEHLFSSFGLTSLHEVLAGFVFIGGLNVNSSRRFLKVLVQVRSQQVSFFVFGAEVGVISLKRLLAADSVFEIVHHFATLGFMRMVVTEVIFVHTIFGLRGVLIEIGLIKNVALRSQVLLSSLVRMHWVFSVLRTSISALAFPVGVGAERSFVHGSLSVVALDVAVIKDIR